MDELISASSAAKTALSATLDQVYTAWLDAKVKRSHSAKTERAYQDTLNGFRATLQAAGLDLDGDPRAVALAAQAWAGHSDEHGQLPAPATYNQRLAILSSFYRYGRSSGLLMIENPIERVERRPVQTYAGARPLDRAEIRRRLAAIDRSTIYGQRDHALLMVGLVTFRRASELASLRWCDVHLAGEILTLTFRHCKGGKVMRDALPTAVGQELLAYLYEVYGRNLGDLAPDAPIWVSCSRNGTAGQAISAQAIADICLKHLGVSKVHSLRHTGARAMEDAGAKVSEIQARLGHSSLATTGKYLAALRAAENPYGDTLAAMFGSDE